MAGHEGAAGEGFYCIYILNSLTHEMMHLMSFYPYNWRIGVHNGLFFPLELHRFVIMGLAVRLNTAMNGSADKYLNSLAPGKFEWNFRYLIFQIILVVDGWGISCELALRWMSPVLADDESTLEQVMAWCRQATSHYLSQCWPRSLPPYGVTRPQWVKPFPWAKWRQNYKR